MFGYLNAGFGAVLGSTWLDRIYDLGFAGIRQDIDIRWKSVVDELGEYQKLSPIFLLGGGHMEDWTKNDFISYTTLVAKRILEKGYFKDVPIYLEIGNEPDIAVREWRENPGLLNETFWECYQAAKSIDRSIELITGGVSNTTKDSLMWLNEFMRDPLPKGAIIGFHRYSNGPDMEKPHPGFPTREHEITRLKSITGTHSLFCTETGLSQGPYKVLRGFPFCWLNKTVWLGESEQSKSLINEWNFYSRRGVLGMSWYQHRDGLLKGMLENNYGIYTTEGNEKEVCKAARSLTMR